MRVHRTILAALVVCSLVGCGAFAGRAESLGAVASPTRSTASRVSPGTRGLKHVNVMSGGHLRSYLLYVPPGDSAKHRLPLVLVYHGVNSLAMTQPAETGLLSVDEQQHNMILAFLQGYDESWNEGAGNTPAHQAKINDVAFTALVLRRIELGYSVDLRRVIATGLSNGALLTELLGCRIAPYLTLIAPVAGQLPVTVSNGCHPSEPISVYEIHGTDDATIPYGGGHFDGVGGGTTVLSAPDSVKRWASLDHCAAAAQQSQSGDDALTSYTGCHSGATVTLETIVGGQHEWPADFAQTLVGAIGSLSGNRRAVLP